MGTFSLFTIRNSLNSVYLALLASIDEVGGHGCGPTFIQNMSLSGEWLGKRNSHVAVRVQHWVPPQEALQVGINGQWYPVSLAKENLEIVTKATSRFVRFVVHNVTVQASVGENTRRVDANKGYNFLNVNVKGIDTKDRSVKLSGLLIRDDFSTVSHSRGRCMRATKFARQKNESLDDVAESEHFLSFATLTR